MEKEIITGDTAISWITDVICELDGDGLVDVFNHVCSGKLEWVDENQYEYTPPKEDYLR